MSEMIAAAVDSPDGFALDLTEELRLRRWARRNYVPAAQRGGEWHPIVLDEMLARDRELAPTSAPRPATDQPRSVRPMGQTYVPLPPTQVSLLDDAHEVPPEPNLSHIAHPLAVEWSL